MGTRGHYLNTPTQACQCGKLKGEEKLGEHCKSCNTLVTTTVNTGAHGRELAHRLLSPSFYFKRDELMEIHKRILEAPVFTNSVDAKVWMHKTLNDVLKVEDGKSLTSVVRKNHATQIAPYSAMAHQVRRMIQLKIPARTGLSLTELLELPPDLYQMVVTACLAYASEDRTDVEEFLNDLT